jgi:hypothetical protein
LILGIRFIAKQSAFAHAVHHLKSNTYANNTGFSGKSGVQLKTCRFQMIRNKKSADNPVKKEASRHRDAKNKTGASHHARPSGAVIANSPIACKTFETPSAIL